MSFAYIALRFVKDVATCAIIYWFGYRKMSFAWFVIPVAYLAIARRYEERNGWRREIAKAMATADEKQLILSTFGKLPSWVFFPDMERAEWFNRILLQIWPNANKFAREFVKKTLEPQIQLALVEYKLAGFEFEKIRLGTIAPRIGGIKVYESKTREEIMMDVELVYAGDCDISFHMKGVSGGIKDAQIRGMMRVIMKPLVSSIPIVGGVQLFFLNAPSIDFNLVGAIDLLDIPGVRDILRKIITEQISNVMVLPNKIAFALSESVPAVEVKMPHAIAVVRAHIVQATQLMKKDVGILGKGKSDPYAIISVGAQKCKTPTVRNSLNPKWDYWCEFAVYNSTGQTLRIQLYDEDDIGANHSSLGRASVNLELLESRGELDQWLILEEAKHGVLHARLFWYELKSEALYLDDALNELKMIKSPAVRSCVLCLYVDSCEHLPDAKQNTRPDPVVCVSLGPNVQRTAAQYRTHSPVYQQGFTFFTNNPRIDNLLFKVVDQKTDSVLGTLSYSLNELLKLSHLEQSLQPFPLQASGAHSTISFSCNLQILKKAEVGGGDASSISSGIASNSFSSEATNNNDSQLITEKIVAKEQCERIMDEVDKCISENGVALFDFSVEYEKVRQQLVITVHSVKLKLAEQCEFADLYVKLYLLPKSKETKRKTGIMKEADSAGIWKFEDSFDYVVSGDELAYRQLQITLMTQRSSFVSRNSPFAQDTLELKDIFPDSQSSVRKLIALPIESGRLTVH